MEIREEEEQPINNNNNNNKLKVKLTEKDLEEIKIKQCAEMTQKMMSNMLTNLQKMSNGPPIGNFKMEMEGSQTLGKLLNNRESIALNNNKEEEEEIELERHQRQQSNLSEEDYVKRIMNSHRPSIVKPEMTWQTKVGLFLYEYRIELLSLLGAGAAFYFYKSYFYNNNIDKDSGVDDFDEIKIE